MGDFVISSYFFSISRLEGFLYSVPPQGDLNFSISHVLSIFHYMCFQLEKCSSSCLQPLRPSTEVTHARHWKQPKKQPKRVPSGSLWNSQKTAGRTAETPEKRPKQLFLGCFGCSSGRFSAVLQGPTRHPFRLFFRLSGIWHLCRWLQRCSSLCRIKSLQV